MASLQNSRYKKLADLRLTSRIEKSLENISQHDSSGRRKIGRVCCQVITIAMLTEVYIIITHSASCATKSSAEQEINDI
jgi:hypothetical protein